MSVGRRLRRGGIAVFDPGRLCDRPGRLLSLAQETFDRRVFASGAARLYTCWRPRTEHRTTWQYKLHEAASDRLLHSSPRSLSQDFAAPSAVEIVHSAPPTKVESDGIGVSQTGIIRSRTVQSIVSEAVDAAIASNGGDSGEAQLLKQLMLCETYFDCEVLLYDEREGDTWRPLALLISCLKITTFGEASSALARAFQQIAQLDQAHTVILLHCLIEGLLFETASLHLLEPLTRLLLSACGRILHSTRAAADERRWQHEVACLLEGLVAHLIRSTDIRCRRSAFHCLEWTLEQRQSFGRLNAVFERMLQIMAGVRRKASSERWEQALLTPYWKGQYSLPYVWRPVVFESRDRLGKLVLEARSPGPALAVITALIQHSTHARRPQMASFLFKQARAVQGERPMDESWSDVTSQYFQSLLSQHRGNSQSLLSKVQAYFDDVVFPQSKAAEQTHWASFFSAAASKNAFGLQMLVQLMLRSNATPSATRFLCGPPATMLRSETFFQAFFRGVAKRPQLCDSDASTCFLVWEEMLNRDIDPTAGTVMALAEVLVRLKAWEDALDFMSLWLPKITPSLMSVRLHLEEVGVPLNTVRTSATFRERPRIGVAPDTTLANYLWALRRMMRAANTTRTPAASYALWKNSSGLFGAEPDEMALRQLMIAAIKTTWSNVASAGKRGLDGRSADWDGLPPLLQTRRIFREILFSEHPELLDNSPPVHRMLKEDIPLGFSLEQPSQEPPPSFFRWIGGDALKLFGLLNPPPPERGSESILDGLDTLTPEPTKPWRSVAFRHETFAVYMQLWLHIQVLTDFQRPDAWKEPLQMLSFMRQLGIQPRKQTMVEIAYFVIMPMVTLMSIDEFKAAAYEAKYPGMEGEEVEEDDGSEEFYASDLGETILDEADSYSDRDRPPSRHRNHLADDDKDGGDSLSAGKKGVLGPLEDWAVQWIHPDRIPDYKQVMTLGRKEFKKLKRLHKMTQRADAVVEDEQAAAAAAAAGRKQGNSGGRTTSRLTRASFDIDIESARNGQSTSTITSSLKGRQTAFFSRNENGN